MILLLNACLHQVNTLLTATLMGVGFGLGIELFKMVNQ